MNTGIILQARLGSTRYSNKILKEIYNGKTILDLVIDRILIALPNTQLVVATTNNLKDNSICDFLKNKKINYFRGSENNVLLRFINTAKEYDFTNILRVCSDNPFIDIPSLIKLKNTFEFSKVDYCSFLINNNLPSIKSHLGFWAEAVKLSALQQIKNLTDNPKYLEHVTNYIYENKNDFKIKYIDAPNELIYDNIRLTVDTKNDFKVIKLILEKMHNNDLLNSIKILDVIKKNKNILELMKNEIKRNQK